MIDLDVVPPPAATGLPRPVGWMRWVVLAAALLVVLSLAPPAGAAGLPEVMATGTRPVTVSLLGQRALYTVQGDTVRAWPLQPGGPAWSARIGGRRGLMLRDGVLIAARSAPGEDDTEVDDADPYAGAEELPGAETAFVFFDATTGAALWRTAVGETGVLGDGVVAVRGRAELVGARMRVADLRTGRTVWQRRDLAVYHVDSDADGRRLFLVTADGRGRVFDFADGRQLANRPLGLVPDLWTSDFAGYTARDVISDGRIYAYGESETVPFLRVFDLQTLRLVEKRAEKWDGLPDEPRASDVRTAGLLLHSDTVGPNRMWITDTVDGRVLGALPGITPAGCEANARYLVCPSVGGARTVWRRTR